MARWLDFWFRPTTPTDLAVCRLTFFSGVLLVYAGEDFTAWAGVSRAFWTPLPAFTFFGLTPLSPSALFFAEAVWRAALAFSAIGVFTRASMWVAAVLSFYL